MKFAHIADAHIGGWRDQKLRELSNQAFCMCIDKCIQENVNFVLLCGDLFDTALPSVECLKLVVQKFRELNEKKIPVYYIAGSHDFSPSGKTMLDVLESAGLMINVVKGEEKDGKLRLQIFEDKTGAKIAGLFGKKGGLEKGYYEDLDYEHLEKAEGFKIFMFHSAITELKTKELEKMNSAPVSTLPKKFDYYAGGHVHIIKNCELEGYKKIVYPGPLFPNSFSELEKLKIGGFYIYENGGLKYVNLEVKPVKSLIFDCENKKAEEVYSVVKDEVKSVDLKDAIVTARFKGQLKDSKTSDIDFKEIERILNERGAYYVLKNTTKLVSKDYEEIKTKFESIEKAENSVIEENIGQSKVFSAVEEKKIIKQLIKSLSNEKYEGEKVADYEERIISEADESLN